MRNQESNNLFAVYWPIFKYDVLEKLAVATSGKCSEI